jgi:hypothetical protein
MQIYLAFEYIFWNWGLLYLALLFNMQKYLA